MTYKPCLFGTTQKYKWVGKVKSKAKTIRNFNVDPLKIFKVQSWSFWTNILKKVLACSALTMQQSKVYLSEILLNNNHLWIISLFNVENLKKTDSLYCRTLSLVYRVKNRDMCLLKGVFAKNRLTAKNNRF